MERSIWVVLLLHVVTFTSAGNETASSSGATISSTEHSTTVVPTPKTLFANGTKVESTELESAVNLSGNDTTLVNVSLNYLNQPVQGDGTKKSSVPRKGIKEPIKARKGATLIPNEQMNITSTSPLPLLKFKPLASETKSTEDEVSVQPDYTALIVGLSLGIALVLILASVTYWRLRDVWERRQYKRVDFLIDGLYTDT